MTEEAKMPDGPPIGVTGLSPGWTEDLAMPEYLGDRAVSASKLWQLHTSTPAHLLHSLQQRGDDTTDAKEAGTAVHAAVYEPELFELGYVVIGQCEATVKSSGDRCTNQGSVWRDGQSFCGVKGHDPHGKDTPMDPSIVTMTAEHRRKAEAMRDALHGHATASKILTAPGPKEVTGVWQDPVTGLWCRIRPDQMILDPEGAELFHWSVVNLKSSGQDIGEESFPRLANRLGYYFKAAFYRMGVRELWDIEPQNFLYPVVEQSAPHEVIVYRLNEDALDIGEAEVRHTLNQLAECVESGRWPGYGPAIRDLNLPDWRLKQVHDIDFLVDAA